MSEDAVERLSERSTTRRSITMGYAIDIVRDYRDKQLSAMCAAIFQRTGHADLMRAAKATPAGSGALADVSTDPGDFAGLSLLDMARRCLDRQGIAPRGLKGEEIVERALTVRTGMQTSSDFTVLMETAVNRLFLGAYAMAPVTWRRFCGVKPVADFRPSGFYRPGSLGTLDTLTEAGNVRHKPVPDGEKATITATTRGNIISISRRAIANDDIGAFKDLAVQLGDAAAYSVEADVYALLGLNAGLGPTQSDSQPLFHANRANIGATGAMSVTTWDSAAAAMAAQRDPAKNQLLELAPAVWLGPAGLRASAYALNRASGPTPSQGLLRDVITTSQLTGTRHYFFADPAAYPTFAVGFVAGREAPVIDSRMSKFNDGLQLKVTFDYGCGALDARSAVTCAGA
jgi:hypothetical protein